MFSSLLSLCCLWSLKLEIAAGRIWAPAALSTESLMRAKVLVLVKSVLLFGSRKADDSYMEAIRKKLKKFCVAVKKLLVEVKKLLVEIKKLLVAVKKLLVEIKKLLSRLEGERKKSGWREKYVALGALRGLQCNSPKLVGISYTCARGEGGKAYESHRKVGGSN